MATRTLRQRIEQLVTEGDYEEAFDLAVEYRDWNAAQWVLAKVCRIP